MSKHLLVSVFMVLVFSVVNGQSVSESRKIADFIHDSANAKKFLSREVDRNAIQVVFVFEGKRYTVNAGNGHSVLSYWVRPSGTVSSDRVSLSIFYDTDVDGVVDFGTKGVTEDHLFNRNSNRGIEHIPYWQEQYRSAVVQTLRFIASKQP
ncbi:MAG: hypothetical protein A2751_02675 [Candidatus Doudnabacteria bacterium RIFCSPHIGHO2_01_FULL_46_14]|uniref:Uncharacterized protein n=1 Tax=Candidatus Doudnabacteria bacterium RIFCSPHIGHO2_01_FULL_46_14 TaxID=1817824 RepID=A0A1F5NJV2_9BACT|nr:MAG: hypothetical protein A2751_02675 [Candidatus Doudnabacteria bacterium RIFCSPHIGHO2_01_FULL_46_14]